MSYDNQKSLWSKAFFHEITVNIHKNKKKKISVLLLDFFQRQNIEWLKLSKQFFCSYLKKIILIEKIKSTEWPK